MDAETVRSVAEQLKATELRVWLDEWELVPGRPWMEAVEAAIERCRSAAVFLGPGGLGGWEQRELRGLLGPLVERALPIIPVLLPGSDGSRLPVFLRDLMWVDLRDGVTPAALDRLVRGIRGEPEAAREDESDRTWVEPTTGTRFLWVPDGELTVGAFSVRVQVS